jgi:hypothetical protein
MIGSRFSSIAVRKSEIAANGPLVPTFEGPSDDRSGKPIGLDASEATLSDYELLCQLDLADLNFLSERN